VPGLLLSEAIYGDLQTYIDSAESKFHYTLRKEWSLQLAEAVPYVHEKGIVHSNLSTTNVLVHQTSHCINLILADFGGSRCHDLSLDGGLLPDEPFLDPKLTSFDSPPVQATLLHLSALRPHFSVSFLAAHHCHCRFRNLYVGAFDALAVRASLFLGLRFVSGYAALAGIFRGCGDVHENVGGNVKGVLILSARAG
jgi:serine/threonine protein kinase